MGAEAFEVQSVLHAGCSQGMAVVACVSWWEGSSALLLPPGRAQSVSW